MSEETQAADAAVPSQTNSAQESENKMDVQVQQQPEGEESVDAMKARLKELEDEADRLAAMQNENGGSGDKNEAAASLQEPKEDIDARSVYVGNVDYGTTPEELQQHFQSCGTINRVTILTDKFTGHPKGFAYVEFAEPSLVVQALVLNESMFRGRPLKVTPKRTNVPGMSRGRGRGRGRGGRAGYRGGYRGRGRGRGFFPY